MDALYLIGRILFSAIFLMSGVGHLTKLDSMSRYAASKGAPAPKPMTAITGLMILAGGLSVLLGVYMEVGAWLLVFFLLPTSFVMHDFWAIDDPMEAQAQQAQFMKNMAMTGAALVLYWMVQSFGYGPYTLGSPMG